MRILTAITAAAVSLSATPAPTAEGVGEIMAVIDLASVSGQAGERTLAVGSRVFIGDLVATDAAGETQLLFFDGTRMVVGHNSSLDILFSGNATENKFAIRALAGSFRFISGDQNHTIRTPSATIGMSGTAFDFTVTPEGETKVLLLEGEVTLCNEDGEDGEDGDCATVATPCALLQTDTGQDVEEIEAGNERVQETREHFPYMTSESSLLEEFRIAGYGCASGGLADSVLSRSAIPAEAIIVGAFVVLGGVVIGLVASNDSNNKTND
jgi:ferric-dicitrate binding protein FerR (iron transport regulator)